MKNKVIRLYKDEFKKVDDFLLKNFSSPTHWQDWNNVISKFYNTEFFYLVITDKDKINGICPVHRKKNKHLYKLISGPREYYMPFGGWIFSESMNFDFSLIELRKNEFLEMFSLPLIKEFNAGYEGCDLLKLYKTSLIHLERSEEDIWNSLTSQKRYKIRKAIRNNIDVMSLNEIGIDKYYEFYNVANKRYGLESMSKEFFLDLLNSTRNIKVDYLIALKDSEIIGSVVLVSDKCYSIYWLGTRVEKAPNIGYFDLLHWEMIKKAKSRGCKYYDLCYLEEDRLPNIFKFKIGYSGDIHSVLNIVKKPVTYKIMNKIQKII